MSYFLQYVCDQVLKLTGDISPVLLASCLICRLYDHLTINSVRLSAFSLNSLSTALHLVIIQHSSTHTKKKRYIKQDIKRRTYKVASYFWLICRLYNYMSCYYVLGFSETPVIQLTSLVHLSLYFSAQNICTSFLSTLHSLSLPDIFQENTFYTYLR